MITPTRERWLATGSVIVLAAVFALRRIGDFDTWWHLAAGRFIATHGTVPATDTLSHTVRDHAWVNLQWGFELIVFWLHQLGGPDLLVWAAAVAFGLAVWLTLRLVRESLGDVAGAVLMIPVVLVAQDRFEVRPEMITFVLLAAVLSVLESGQQNEDRGLWRLVPLMAVWVNTHALFVIGLFAIASALATPSRRLVYWGGAATAAVLANPFGLTGALFPLELVSLIDRSDPVFQTIAEFRSPFAPDAGGVSIAAYKLLLACGVLAVGFRVLRGVKTLDPGGLIFFVGLAALSVAARRNTALFALGAAPYLARSLAIGFAALPPSLSGRVKRAAPVAARIVFAGSMALSVFIMLGTFYRWDGRPREFGTGVLEGVFPARAAAAAREAGLPGKLYNDVAAGGYLAWDDPFGDGVFIDGRMEVYDAAFFADYVASMYDPDAFARVTGRYGINTVVLFHHWENRRLMVERLFRSGEWALVYADEVAAVFVRGQGNEGVFARAAALTPQWNEATRAWLARPAPRWRFAAGRVEGTRAFARLLATVGDANGAAETYERLLSLRVRRPEEIEVRLILARHYAGTGQVERARDHARRVLALAPSHAEAQKLLN